jgi:cytochrome c-type biogenesis protein CcmH
MRNRAWPVGIGLTLALVGIVAVLALGATGELTAAQRVDALAAELRCPDCQGLSVADSPTRSAQEMRRQIADLVASGADDAAVRKHFAARYGEWIHLAPSAPAVWFIPFVVVIAGAVALFAWLARRSEGSEPGTRPDAAERRRLHDEVEALDA